MKNKKLNSKIFKERKVIFSGILIALIVRAYALFCK